MENLEPLFSELKVIPNSAHRKIDAIPAQEIKDWLRQTRGILTNALRVHLGYLPDPYRNHITYTGPLTLEEQRMIFYELR